MISRFYINLTFANTIDCRASGWRELGVNAVTIERLEIDGTTYEKEYTDHILLNNSVIYRELERKLGLPRYSLKHKPTVSEQSNVNL